MITQEILKEQLNYCEITGIFLWKIRKGGSATIGSLAGSTDSKGYRQIRILNKLYLAHRLAWLYSYGMMPESDIDHIDRNPKNNAIKNLRLCIHSENHQNINIRSSNTSGHCGVFQVRRSKKWIAYICVNQKNISLGTYENIEDAIEARRKGKEKYHAFAANNGVNFNE